MRTNTTFRLLLKLVFIFMSMVLMGQEKVDFDRFESEEVNLQTNGSVFLSGETIYISIFSFLGSSSQPSSLSKIVYVTLIDNSGKELVSQKIAMNNGRGSGDIFLGTNLETGHYKLIAYTRWMLNFGKQHFFEKDLILINPYRTNESGIPYSDSSKNFENFSDQKQYSPFLSINLEKSILKTRKPLAINLLAKGKDAIRGSYTLSVKKVDSLALLEIQSSKDIQLDFDRNLNSDSLIAPELRGALISGKLEIEENIKSKKNITVSLSLLEEDLLPEFALTDEAGEFTWVLDELPTSQQASLAAINLKDRYHFKIYDDPKPDYSGLSFELVSMNRALKGVIERRSVANQIENAYYQFKPDTVISTLKKTPFYSGIEKTFLLDDYTRFNSVKETFTEIILGGAVRMRNGEPFFKVETSNFIEGNEEYPTLLLVDGIHVTNNNFLYNYPATNIESVTIVQEEYYIGPQRFSGIIDVRSFNADFKSQYMLNIVDIKSINPIAVNKNYFNQHYYEDQKQVQSKIPDYRYQLLWRPVVSFQNDSIFFNCFTSDVTGMFEVVVSGFTSSGQPVFVKSYFEVSN